MANHKKRCKKCKYHGKISSLGIICNYILITKHMRGCDAARCNKFEQGKRIKLEGEEY